MLCVDSLIIQKFKHRSVRDKFKMFEHYQKLEHNLAKEKFSNKNNYLPLADEIPEGRKDKEKLVELLEKFYPPNSNNNGFIKKRKKRAGIGNMMRYSSFKKQLGDVQKAMADEKSYKMGEEFINQMAIKIAGIAVLRRDYIRREQSLFARQKDTMNLTQTTLESPDQQSFEEFFKEYKIDRVAKCPPGLIGKIHFMFQINNSNFVIKNFLISRHLSFHCIVTYHFFPSLRFLILHRVKMGEDLLNLILEHCASFSTNIEVVELVGVHFHESSVEPLKRLIMKNCVKRLVFRRCGLTSKVFGGICLAILAGTTVTHLDVSQNSIGKRLTKLEEIRLLGLF